MRRFVSFECIFADFFWDIRRFFVSEDQDFAYERVPVGSLEVETELLDLSTYYEVFSIEYLSDKDTST